MTVHATLDGNVFRLAAGPRDGDRIKMIPGYRAHVHADPVYWTVPASLYQAVLLRALFGEDFTYDDAVHAFLQGERQREVYRQDPSTGPMIEDLEQSLYAFQKLGVGRLLVSSAILADKPGLGKTVQALGALRELHAPPTLVVTTRTMKRVWAREAARWCPEALTIVVAGSAAQRKKQLDAAQRLGPYLEQPCNCNATTPNDPSIRGEHAAPATSGLCESGIRITPSVSETTTGAGSSATPIESPTTNDDATSNTPTTSRPSSSTTCSNTKAEGVPSAEDNSAVGTKEGRSTSTIATTAEPCARCSAIRAIATSAGIPIGTPSTYRGILVCVNWESLRLHSRLSWYGGSSLSAEEKQEKELNAIPFRVVIADEAHRAKDPHSKQTRALWYLGDRADYRWALTGTPIANQYVDLWSLLRFVCPREFSDRGKFIDRYVVMVKRPWGDEPLCLREENKAELFWWVDQFMLRRTPEECPELESMPKVRDVRVDVELTAAQRKAYKALKKEAMAMFDGELLIAADPLSKAQRLRYVASATPVVEDGEVVALTTPSCKVDAMLELFADEALPAVVFAQSSKLIDLAHDVARDKGYRVAKITGPMTDRQREMAVDDFQAGKLDAVFCTAAGGEGITLTAGKSMIFLQSPDSLVTMQQMMGRVPRIGNEREVVCAYHLVSEGTNDEAFYELAVTKTLRLEEIVRDRTRLLGTL